ncbi:hypothetical protein GTU71_00850 [Rathayibacter sp. VKM Ac-2762]|uniref:hypothetical protein n=1 Tax=Rathayibacter sp. VKM Ac-2762 TaxID=2609254 RepID=UPI00132F0CAE|nr:hypothetical protein [Rathayibacter sp. VKM Ac-2762]QHF19547.1 hypothetical protein GTU71_00850 [Rathayibacter sp. VKM Ac-2762]
MKTSDLKFWFIDLTTAPSVMDWAALILTIIGFWIAFVQLRKTKKAAEAATEALTGAQATLSERAMHAIAPQLHHVHEDIQVAMKSGDTLDAQRALLRFSRLANEMGDILKTSYPTHTELVTIIQSASSKATKVKVTLVTKPTTDVPTSLRPVFKDVDAVMVAVDSMTANLRNKLEGAPNV